MFVTHNGFTHYCSDILGQAFISTGQATLATCAEAAQCLDRFVINGNPMMNEISDAFKRIYGKPLSAPESYKKIPNECMKGFSVARALDTYELSDTFKHLQREDGTLKEKGEA